MLSRITITNVLNRTNISNHYRIASVIANIIHVKVKVPIKQLIVDVLVILSGVWLFYVMISFVSMVGIMMD